MREPEGRHPWLLRAKNIDTLFALLLLAGSLLASIFIPQLVSETLLGGAETFVTLTPSLFPRVTTLLLAAAALLYLAQSLREPDERLFRPPVGAPARLLGTLGALFLYTYLLDYLGYLVASVLVLGGLTLYYGNRNVFLILLVGAGTPLFIYLLFQRFLGIALPSGILF